MKPFDLRVAFILLSTYHLAQHIKSRYEGLTIALPPKHWPRVSEDDDPNVLLEKLLRLARRIPPRQVGTSKRGPTIENSKGYVDAKTARSHVSTDGCAKEKSHLERGGS